MNDIGVKNKDHQEIADAHRLESSTQTVLQKLKSMPILIMLVIIWIAFICLNKNFLTINNMITLFVANAYFAVAAAGETFVIMTGGIDHMWLRFPRHISGHC